MNIHTNSGTHFNYLLSRDCQLKYELINLYRIIQDELGSCVDSTRTQMLCIYRELLEKYADRLNHLSLKLERKENEQFGYAGVQPTYEFEEQEQNILIRFSDDIRIIKNSLLRYLNKHRASKNS